MSVSARMKRFFVKIMNFVVNDVDYEKTKRDGQSMVRN